MRDRIMKCIRSLKGEEFDAVSNLYTGGYLDSMDIICLIEKLEQEFDIMVPMDEADPDYFNSIDSIERLVKRNGGEE